MMRNWLRASPLCLLVTLSVGLTSCSTTNVYIVRHAEKLNETDTSSLTPAGFRRAQALAAELTNVRIDSLFSTPYRRTRQTLEPLARQRNLPVGTYAPRLADALAQRIAQLKGKTVLVAGHSNTILDIAKSLGATPKLTRIEAGDYDNLLHVVVKQGVFGKRIRLTERTYGQTTAP